MQKCYMKEIKIINLPIINTRTKLFSTKDIKEGIKKLVAGKAWDIDR